MYTAAITAMEKNGIHQWDEIYPDKQILSEDIEKDQMYIGIDENDDDKDSSIAVCFVLNQECDEEYKNGKWKYPESKFCVIHRLCVNTDFQKRGIATQTMKYIEELCKSSGFDSIRLDCYTLNPYSRRLYEKLGYSVVGYADWRKGRFELREKMI